MISLRCSSLPRVAACAASIMPPVVRVESPRGPADLGSAFHQAIAAHINGEAADLDEIAARWGVDAGDLAPMVHWTRRVWDERLSPLFPAPLVEIAMAREIGSLTLTGTADLIAVADGEVRGIDWKTGWSDTGATDQLRGYAWLAMEGRDCDVARFSKLRVREQRVETHVWTRGELDAWMAGLIRHLADGDLHRPGEHCQWCPRALECQARTQALRQAIDMLPPDSRLARMSDDDLARVVLQARALERVLVGVLDAAKTEVVVRGGVAGPLRIVEQNRRSIDPARGWDVLVGEFGQETVVGMAAIGKGDVETAAKERAPRGQKGTAAKAIIDSLDAVGAITTKSFTRLEVTRGERIECEPARLVGGGDPPAGAAGVEG